MSAGVDTWSFQCHCNSPVNVWASKQQAQCDEGCSSVDACGGHASQVLSVVNEQTGERLCMCGECDGAFKGMACEKTTLHRLVTDPVSCLALGVYTSLIFGMGIIIVARFAGWSLQLEYSVNILLYVG